jgi:energy-coupling factor transporter ATP-binding protein EcfA2
VQIGGLNLRGILVSSKNTDFRYLHLDEQSVALVGKNGVGKTTLLRAIERSFNGISAEDQNPYKVSIDFSLPINIESFLENEDDPGLLKAILLQLRSKSDLAEEIKEDLTTELFTDLLLPLWEESVESDIRNWRYLIWSMQVKNQLATLSSKDVYLEKLIKKTIERNKVLLKSYSMKWVGDDELIQRYIKEQNQDDQQIFHCFDLANRSLEFRFAPFGTLQAPKWKISSIYRINQDELTTSNPLTELAQILTWPKPLTEAIREEGYFESQNESFWPSHIRNIYVQFINQQVFFGMSLGVIESGLGFNLIDPDQITIDQAKVDILEYLNARIEKTPKDYGIDHIKNIGKSSRIRLPQKYENILFLSPEQEVSSGLRVLVETLSKNVTEVFNILLPSSPQILIQINEKRKWITEGIFSICIKDGDSTYPLDLLSDAQKRWAKLAILVSCREFTNLIIFLDEPERGIQRNLEKSLMSALNGFRDIPRFFTSHSAEIITNCDSSILIKSGREGNRVLDKVSGSLANLLIDLDISPGEYFQSKKLLIYMEGEWDKAILDGFGKERFEKEGIEIIAGHGLNSWTAFYNIHDLKLAGEYKLVFWPDSVQISEFDKLIQEIKNKKLPNSHLHKYLREELPKVIPSQDKWTEDQIGSLSAIVAESLKEPSGRIFVKGTGDYDCIMWLSPQILGMHPSLNWEKVRGDFNQNYKPSKGVQKGQAFKNYVDTLIEQHGTKKRLSINRLKEIARELEISGQVPPKIQKLIDEIVILANS